MDQVMAEKLAIRETIDNWILWRDAGDWQRFKTVWHPDGWMNATWFQGPAEQFIEVSREGFNKGVNILHFYGGVRCGNPRGPATAPNKKNNTPRASRWGGLVHGLCARPSGRLR